MPADFVQINVGKLPVIGVHGAPSSITDIAVTALSASVAVAVMVTAWPVVGVAGEWVAVTGDGGVVSPATAQSPIKHEPLAQSLFVAHVVPMGQYRGAEAHDGWTLKVPVPPLLLSTVAYPI